MFSSSSVILNLWLSHPGSFWNIDILGYMKTNLNHNPWRVEPGYHIFRKLIRWFRYSVKIKNLSFKCCLQGSATGPLSFLQYTCTNSPNLVVSVMIYMLINSKCVSSTQISLLISRPMYSNRWFRQKHWWLVCLYISNSKCLWLNHSLPIPHITCS